MLSKSLSFCYPVTSSLILPFVRIASFPQGMPVPHLPLHHYPSSQTMRQSDGPHVPSGHEAITPNPEKNAHGTDRSIVNVQDFQTQHWASSRRPSTPRPIVSSRPDLNGVPPPLPDSQQIWRNSPTVPRLGPPCAASSRDSN